MNNLLSSDYFPPPPGPLGLILGALLLLSPILLFSAPLPATVPLPPPAHKGKVSIEEAIYSRKSVRGFKQAALTLPEISQLLWAAGGKNIDGVTGATRSYPSAGGIYPIEVYLAAGGVKGLAPGIYRYHWKSHSLALLKSGDFRSSLAAAAWGQAAVARGPVTLVFTARLSRVTSRYGLRGENRYLPMDAGHAGQNVALQARALGLGTVMVGAFRDEAVADLLEVRGEEPLYLIPVGRPVPLNKKSSP